MHVKKHDEALINEIISEEMQEIKSCFDAGHKLVTFQVAFTIFSNGSVGKVRISSRSGQNVNKCLMSIFSGLDFPDIDGGGAISIMKTYRIRL